MAIIIGAAIVIWIPAKQRHQAVAYPMAAAKYRLQRWRRMAQQQSAVA